MRYLLLISVFFSTTYCFTQISFENHDIIIDRWRLGGLSSAFPVDFDNDGDLDVLVGRYQPSGGVYWFENIDGEGDFGIQQIIDSDNSYITDVTAGDIDGDGDSDAVAVDTNNNKIYWYENFDGMGTFSPPQEIEANFISGKIKLKLADLNNDSRLDLVYTRYTPYSSYICWIENIGNGFNEHILYTDPGITDFDIADFDNDGDLDVLYDTWGGSGNVYWVENVNGMEDFERHIISSWPGHGSVVAGDVDGDGDEDVVFHIFSYNNYSQFVWCANDGNGNFGAKQLVGDSPDGENIYMQDFDNDGDLDVITGISIQNTLKIFENIDGNGLFEEITVDNTLWEVEDAIPAFIDSDNYVDVLAVELGGSHLTWLKNKEGSGEFGFPINVSKTVIFNHALSVADLNNDGLLDIICASGGTNEVSWFPNLDNSDKFKYQHPFPMLFELSSAGEIYSLDLDVDGDIDVFFRKHKSIYYFENLNGLGKFSTPQEVYITLSVGSIIGFNFIDFEGDGDQDIVFGDPNGDLVILENIDGHGNFGTPVVIDNLSEMELLKIQDINGDNLSDIITTADFSSGRKVVYLLNLGNGQFGPHELLPGLYQETKDLNFGDINGDGFIDILLRYDNPGRRIATYINQNNNGFNEQVDLPMELYIKSSKFILADVNDDGYLDLVYSDNDENCVWAKNNGNGEFEDIYFITNNLNTTTAILASDIDMDDDLDIILTAGFHSSGYMKWCENDLYVLGTEVPIDEGAMKDFLVYPNPAKNYITIKASSIIKIELFDISGVILKTEKGCNCSEQTFSITHKSGIYFAKITSDTSTQVMKIIIE